MTHFRTTIGIALALALLVTSSAHAQLTGGNVAVLMFRILAFDRTLPERSPDKTSTVLVLYKNGLGASESRFKEVRNALEELASKASISGLNVRVVAAPYTDAAQLELEFGRQRVGAVFVCPGLDDHLAAIGEVSKKRKVLSFIDDDSKLGQHIAIAIVPRGGKAGVVVNLAASRAQGADLDSAFLKLVEVRR